MNNDRK
jgi:hypothetical protein